MKFPIGAKVEYELAEDGDPRWDFNIDRGGTGRFAKAIVVGMGNREFFTEAIDGEIFAWPNDGWDDQDYGKRPGYVRSERGK